MARLVIISPDFAHQSCELPEGCTSIGRGPKNSVIIRDGSVSADHCEIHVYGTSVIVREHGSSNGTFLNGVRIPGQSGVRPGDVIHFGRVEARVELDPDLVPDTDATSGTALHGYRRAQAAASHPAPQATFPVLLEPRSADDPDHATVLLSTNESRSPLPPAPDRPAMQPIQRASSRRWMAVWVALLLVALTVWLLRR